MRKLITALLVAAILVGAFALAVDAQTTYQRFENLWARTLRSTGDTVVGGALAVTGGSSMANLSSSGDVALGGALNTGTFVVNGSGGNLAVVEGTPLAAVRSFQQISAAATAGVTVTTLAKGTELTLLNMGSNTITISDTGTTMLESNAALGQYDTLTLISDGTNMVELARSNN